MIIKRIVQGENAVNDRALFATMGAWLTSREISETLGSPIFSEPGDIWHLAVDSSRELLGFSLTHVYKTTKTAHIRFLFVPAGDGKIQKTLMDKVIEEAKGQGLKSIYTYDRKDGIWDKEGFKKHKRPRSSFYKWEKII